MKPRAVFLKDKQNLKHLPILTKKNRERTQINKIRNERDVTTNNREIQKIIKDYNYTPTNWTS